MKRKLKDADFRGGCAGRDASFARLLKAPSIISSCHAWAVRIHAAAPSSLNGAFTLPFGILALSPRVTQRNEAPHPSSVACIISALCVCARNCT